MTMNYCGRCGSANGNHARFCRQCGAELSSQAALSSLATPLNVEFSAKAAMKESEEATISTPPESNLTETEKTITENLQDETDQSGPDPIAVSKSLRRVRASGSLIIEASKKKQDEMNKIIAQAIEGVESRTRESSSPPPAKPQPSPRPMPQPANKPLTQTKVHLAAPAASSGATVSRRPNHYLTGTPARSGPLTGHSHSFISSVGQLPPNGPSSVLAQASGLNPKAGYSTRFRVGMILLAVLLLIGILFRERYLTPPTDASQERDLKRVEDQSEQYLRLGERDRQQGQYESALGNFQQALLLTPNNPNVHFQMAQTYYNAGLIDEALKAYRALLRIAPEHLEARLQVAQIYQSRGNWNAAYQEYQRIIALDQNSSQAAVALEKIEAYQGSTLTSFPATFSDSRRARKVLPNSPELPSVSSSQGQIPFSTLGLTAPPIKPPAVLNNKSDENPDPISMAEIRKKLGLRYLNVREYYAAINEFLSALRLTPDDKDIYYFLGSAYFGLGQFGLAHDYYKRVDRGQYVQVAQSGAQRTEKAAREELKRRLNLLKTDGKNEIKKESDESNQIMNHF